jgi:hypothetical protein
MVRRPAINMTPLTIFGLFAVTISCQKFRAYRRVCTDLNWLCYNSAKSMDRCSASR